METCCYFKNNYIHIGINITSINFLQTILAFRNLIEGKSRDSLDYVPITSLHITLCRLNLKNTIMDESSFSSVKEIIEDVVEHFKFKDLSCFPNTFYYGEESHSVKVYFQRNTVDLLNDIRYEILHMASERGIQTLDLQRYVPHITIIRNLQIFHRNLVHECVSLMNEGYIPSFVISKINMLEPKKCQYEADKKIISRSKKLSVFFR